MPTKPDFDPDLHLSEAKRNEFEDEELARRIQRELEEEENAERERDSSQRSSQEMDDMELARRLQFGEEAEGLEDPMQRHLDDRQRETGISDQMEYARRLQQQALRDVNTTAPAASRDSQSGSNSNEEEDPDLALARRMNEMYAMGMDSCADFESFQALTTGDSQSAAIQTGGSNHGGRQFRSQEEEDAAIARLMAESGESLRHIDLNNLPQPGSSDEASGSRPGAHHVPIPAGYSETMMQASTRPVRTPPTGVLFDADQVDVPRKPSSGSRAASREAASAGGRSYPPSTAPKRSSLPRSGERMKTLPEDGIDPPGVPLPPPVIDAEVVSADAANSKSKSKPRSGGLFGLGVLPKSLNLASERAAPKIPVSSRPPPKRKPGPVPYSVSASRLVDVPAASATPKKKSASRQSRSSKPPICCECNQPATHYLSALDKRYHHDCFRCMGCHNLIDTTVPFAYMQDEQGDKHPLHRECFSELYGVKCAVCKKTIPAGPDGKVSFVKHPFFDTEQMCPSHAASPGRRCTGCHRFEPEDEPFADLDDVGRVVCYSCCRTAVVDSSDAAPLWRSVIRFFDKKLNLPIWPDMKEVPVLIVGYKSLNEQMKQTGGVHGGSSQIMTRGVCLTEHQTSGRKLKTTTLKFNERKQSFERRDEHQKGFTFLQVPDANKVNPDSSVTCILCLSGLPRDLTASILAHEATHAWIKLHPKYDVLNPLDPQVEEGCAQLVAMLYLSEGLPPASGETDGDGGPSEEKLRQYFKFSIESDNHEIYGEGYRKAAAAYSKIGILALLSHVVLYKEFPNV